MIIIMWLCLARILEAFRDAEAFERPVQDRSVTWHLLKIVQFLCLFMTGGAFVFKQALTGDAYWWMIGAIGIAYFVFEFSLRLFRNHFKRRG